MEIANHFQCCGLQWSLVRVSHIKLLFKHHILEIDFEFMEFCSSLDKLSKFLRYHKRQQSSVNLLTRIQLKCGKPNVEASRVASDELIMVSKVSH